MVLCRGVAVISVCGGRGMMTCNSSTHVGCAASNVDQTESSWTCSRWCTPQQARSSTWSQTGRAHGHGPLLDLHAAFRLASVIIVRQREGCETCGVLVRGRGVLLQGQMLCCHALQRYMRHNWDRHAWSCTLDAAVHCAALCLWQCRVLWSVPPAAGSLWLMLMLASSADMFQVQ